jgi:transcriptional regulator with XRE-family HTH domain
MDVKMCTKCGEVNTPPTLPPATRGARMTLASRITETRAAAGISQRELARRAGVSESYISLLELGTRRVSTPVLRAIAAELGCTAAWLRSGRETAERRCSTCAHYSGPDSECRHAPPTIVAIDGAPVGAWPPVDEDQWCGRWEVKS